MAYSAYEIFTIDATGGPPFNITKDSTGLYHDTPDYSPDGEKIANTGHDENDFEIYKIHHNGGTPVKGTNTKSDEVWLSRP